MEDLNTKFVITSIIIAAAVVAAYHFTIAKSNIEYDNDGE